MGMISFSIKTHSQPSKGEFYVMAPKYLQEDLVLGRKLAKAALDLQRSQSKQKQGITLEKNLNNITKIQDKYLKKNLAKSWTLP